MGGVGSGNFHGPRVKPEPITVRGRKKSTQVNDEEQRVSWWQIAPRDGFTALAGKRFYRDTPESSVTYVKAREDWPIQARLGGQW